MHLFKMLFALGIAASAYAETVNVSKIVTGVFTPTPFLGLVIPNGTPLANTSYYPVVHAKTGADPLDMYPGPWASAWAGSVTNPAIKRQTNTPAPVQNGNVTISYAKPWTQLGQAGLNNQNKQFTTAAVFGSGSASSATTYAVRLEHFGAQATDYYLTVTAPEIKRIFEPAYSLCCSGDSNGGTYAYLPPKSASSRAAVDIYADGLPVWTSEATYEFPLGSHDAFAKYELAWGAAQAAPKNVLLYLGRFTTGQSVHLSIVVRTDSLANAPNCGDESAFGYVTKHCFDNMETVTLTPSGQPKVPAMYLWSPTAAIVFGRI